MKALLICPSDRPGVSHLAEGVPLSNVPMLGKTLLEYWLDHLATLGAKEVVILSSDRPHLVRNLVNGGTRWGLKVEVIPERWELTVTEARAKYIQDAGGTWLSEPNDTILMDHLPGLRQHPLFNSYAGWFEAVHAYMWRAGTPDRIGLRQLSPGIWVGLRSRVSPKAKLQAPCWIGRNVWVGDDAVIGPSAILDDKVFVEKQAEISHSVIGPETFVGEFTDVRNSFAWGSTLLNWARGSCTRVPDRFLLCALADHRLKAVKATTLLPRLAALITLLLTWPVGFAAILRSFFSTQPAFRACRAVHPQLGGSDPRAQEITYYELTGAGRWLKRWPQLWNIFRGEFAWVGNRPLTKAQAALLSNDFERLWLNTSVGLVSLADVRGAMDSLNDESRAHASFYAVQHHWKLDLSILASALFEAVFGAGIEPLEEKEELPVSLQPSVVKEKA
ncbi:MAG TPA: sugar transferase [Verrucomicrobiae bacterium]|nr:sugar transferase [Verrucomicrobiae bacterium]